MDGKNAGWVILMTSDADIRRWEPVPGFPVYETRDDARRAAIEARLLFPAIGRAGDAIPTPTDREGRPVRS